jgi:hypothetical protein
MNALHKFSRRLGTFSAALLLASSAAIVSAQSYYETLKWVPSDGAEEDYFGIRVAISGETAIIGAYRDSDQTDRAGAAYLYSAQTGFELMQLYASDYSTNDRFGAGVAINESYAIVGSIYDDDNGSQSGSAYVFDAATGVELRKIRPLDGSTDENFGSRLAISGTTIVGGLTSDDDNGLLSGSAYLFNATTGVQIAKLLPSDGGAVQDYFGISVAIDGDLVIVGAYRDDDNGNDSGSAYLFDATTGAELAKLLPNDGDSYDSFGSAVGISGDTVIVGARGDELSGTSTNSGSAYVFDVSDPLAPVQTHKLFPDDGSPATLFGNSLAISGEIAVISRPYDPFNAGAAGSAYLFNTTTGAQITKLVASDGAYNDRLGLSVAINNNTAVLGAFNDDDNGDESGSAYLFDFSPGVPYCSGAASQCPCGNTGSSGSGCANSTGGGAHLSAFGTDSVSADLLTLKAEHLPVGPGLYFQGENAVNGGQGSYFGDGLRCAGGGVIRLEVQFSSGGNSHSTVSIVTKGGVVAGQTKHYQLWYRDPNTPCGSTFNLTNGYEITWIP